MNYHLLLVDGAGEAQVKPLRIRTLREFPGEPGVSVHFRPVRNDRLFESAKVGGALAFRILFGEGIVRTQQWVEYEVAGDPVNVTGRSADLLFFLALITAAWKRPGPSPVDIAATGILESDGSLRTVDHVEQKLAAAVAALQSSPHGVIFYPAADAESVAHWRLTTSVPPNVQLYPVRAVDEALACLGFSLDKVYLRNPFRGLEHFDYEHRAIFFGRDAEVREVVQQLLRREAAGTPGVLIEGPSGSGKSSFIRAGLLPALIEPRRLLPEIQSALQALPVPVNTPSAIWRPNLVPRQADESVVVASIQECWSNLPPLAQAGEPHSTLGELARWRRERWTASLRHVWFIDQFEELFSLDLEAPVLAAIGSFLLNLQQQGVWLLVSIRTDALPALKREATLRSVFGSNEGQYYLAGLSLIGLDEVIHRPALAASLRFEERADGATLDQLLKEEAYRERDALPLLQFTLNELYRRRSDHTLTMAAYESLGGLSGSVATTAASILQDVPTRLQERLFRSLVQLNTLGEASRRYAPLLEIQADGGQAAVLARLVDARLCVTDRRDGQAVAAFAHDSLLQTLPALTQWLKRESDLLQTRDLVEREALLWTSHDRSDAWLASPDRLADFATLEAAQIYLSDEVRAYMTRSAAKARRARRLKRAAVAAIAVLAMAASVAAWVATQKQHEAERQTALANLAKKRALTEAAAGRLKDGELSYARGIVLSVLKDQPPGELPDAASINVFQEVRAADPLQVVLTGHTDAVRNVAYSPDGARVVSASLDGTFRIWDVRTGIEIAVLWREADHAAMYARYSPDGSRLLTSSGGKARLWDASTRTLLFTLADPADDVGSAAFSPDGSRIVTYLGKRVRIWDARTGSPVVTFAPQPAEVSFTLYSPDGRRILTLQDNTVRILDSQSGALLTEMKGHVGNLICAAYAPDGQRIATASADATARIWDARSGAELYALNANVGQVWGVAYSPDGQWIATGATDKKVRIWDAKTGSPVRILSGHTAIIGAVAFSPDNAHLASAGYDETARVWDLRDGPDTLVLRGHGASVSSVEYSPDGGQILSNGDDGTARIWNSTTGAPIATLSGEGGIGSAKYSPDGTSVLTVADDKNFREWDARTGALLRVIPSNTAIRSASFSPDKSRILAALDGFDFGVWDVAARKQLFTGKGHQSYINALEFSPDGRRILTASVDKTARLWDATTGAQLMVLPHFDHLNGGAFSPDGKLIVTGSNDKAVRIWDAATAEKRLTLIGHHAFVFQVGFSPDGRRVVSASRDKTVRIWDAQTGVQLAVLTGHRQNVWGAAFSPDGRHVASASGDQTIRIWDATIPTDLHGQIEWAQAAESDPFSDIEARQLGIQVSEQSSSRWATASHCDQAAGAIYDPDRRAPGIDVSEWQPDYAAAMCRDDEPGSRDGARRLYERGRVAAARGDFDVAGKDFNLAAAQGYRAALIDAALLLTDPAAKRLDPARAIALYESAWKQGVPFAAYQLGQLYESGITESLPRGVPPLTPDRQAAWDWYRRGAERQEPHAMARFGQRAEQQALTITDPAAANRHLLRAFDWYARATECAQRDSWPDAALKRWRYRRATLARVLAAAGQMALVAEHFERLATSPLPAPDFKQETLDEH